MRKKSDKYYTIFELLPGGHRKPLKDNGSIIKFKSPKAARNYYRSKLSKEEGVFLLVHSTGEEESIY